MNKTNNELLQFLLDNPDKWRWNPSRYNKSVIGGFSFKGKHYDGYNLKDAIFLAVDEFQVSNTPMSD